ncbi:MAG: hypothetical protein ACXWIU_05290, partial [Limisphaerales bacterium]
VKSHRAHGWLIAELMFALSFIVIALIPLAYSFRTEQKLVRAHYNQAVAMEIIDGEMEILHAGDWRNLLEGEHSYKVTAASATNLPPGAFFLSRTGALLRLEWRPTKKQSGGTIVREVHFSQK